MRGRIDSIGTNIPQTKQTIWDKILALIQQLFEMRLVQHLAMPTERSKKEILVSKFREKMNILHFTLKQVRQQTYKSTDTHYQTRQRNLSRAALESKYFEQRKDRIKIIQMMYTQLFFEGSFKHYHKVAMVLGFPLNLDPIDIQEWAKNCQVQEPLEEKCCCEEGGCCCHGDGCCCCCYE